MDELLHATGAWKWPQLPRNPQADSNLKSPHGLLGQIDAVLGSELLGSQSGSKIRVLGRLGPHPGDCCWAG
jgi:hypothetical protein